MMHDNLYARAVACDRGLKGIDAAIRQQAREAVTAAGLPLYPFVVDHAEVLIRRDMGLEAVHAALTGAFALMFVEEGR